MSSSTLIQKIWNFCHTPCDDSRALDTAFATVIAQRKNLLRAACAGQDGKGAKPHGRRRKEPV